jgi:hypothetical protein
MLKATRSFCQLELLVMPKNLNDTQMVLVIHKTLRLIHRSLLVARAAKTKCCNLISFAQSILLRFAAQSFVHAFDFEGSSLR